jgi:hypothetical protein
MEQWEHLAQVLKMVDDAMKPDLTPGDWYARKQREAEAASAALREAKTRGAGPEEIARLERQLELARYVGD